MRRPSRLHTLVMAFAAIATLSRAPAAQSSGDVTLGIEGRINQTPWVAGDGDFVAVTWGARKADGTTDVFVATSRDGGITFGKPVQANTAAGEARLGGEMPPRVALARRDGRAPEVVILWTARIEGRTEIRSARSMDGGQTFARPVTCRRRASPAIVAGPRWPSTVPARPTRWLDHRGMAETSGTHQHAGHAQTASAPDKRDGVAMAQKSGLFYSGAGSSNRELVKGVCYCCKTALATGAGGAVFAAWRQVYAGNIRDIAFMQSKDGGKTFGPAIRISEDGWQLDGCPDDGPAMAVDRSNIVHIVWPTVIGGANPEGALFYSSTKDGRVFTPRQRIPTLGSPKPSHPQIAIDAAGGLHVAWDEVANGVRRAATRPLTVTGSGVASFGEPRVIAGPSAYPVMAATARGLLAVWTSGPLETSTIAVRRIKP